MEKPTFSRRTLRIPLGDDVSPSITDWLEMKDALLRNYLPPIYRSSLLEEWDHLKQGTCLVAEYIEKFKEFKRRI